MSKPDPPAAESGLPVAAPKILYRNVGGVSHLALSCSFDRLREAHPEFRRAWDGIRPPAPSDGGGGQSLGSRATHDFNAALSRALIREHFGLSLPSLPEGRLCPPIPNRSNYVRWLRDLVVGSSADLSRFAAGEAERRCRGLDIGTGVSAVYPLLLSTELFADSDALRGEERRRWRFLATDIDPVAISSARANVEANGLGESIQVELVDGAEGPLASAMCAAGRSPMFARGDDEDRDAGGPLFDFVMTNPPFYSSSKEASEPRAGDKRSRTDMASNECVYTSRRVEGTSRDEEDGGDVGFISAIMNDSSSCRTDVTWYTSLVAKRTSLTAVLAKLRELPGVWGNRGQIRSVEFRQGNIEGDSGGGDGDCRGSERVRWGVAWTYERAADRCAACMSDAGVRPFRVSLDEGEAVRRLVAFVDNLRGYELRHSAGRRSRSSAGGVEDGEHRCLTVAEARFGGCNPTSPPAAHGNVQQDNTNLPSCGHFLLDIFVISHTNPDEESTAATVVIEAFCHTRLGESMARKIAAQLQGEITRTNRRWRRLLKRGLDPG